MVWDLWCLEDWEEKADLVTELINYEAVCRTAPATLGLLNIVELPDISDTLFD